MENKVNITSDNTPENISNLSNLIYLIRRVFENYLELKPDEINEDDIFNLARKAEAKKLGENMDDYHSTDFLNYSFDWLGFYMELEQALDIEICDEDTVKIISFADLAIYLNGRKENRLTNEHLKLNPKYFDSLLAHKEKLNIIFVGRDPYPNDSMGIPFCKNEINKLRKTNCSGRYLLRGFGVDIMEKKYDDFQNTEDMFFSLLMDKGIGLVNASYFPISKKAEKYQIKLSSYLNNLLFSLEGPKVIMTKSAEVLFKMKEKPLESGYKLLETPSIQMPIKDTWSIVCHPDFRNSRREDHKTFWQELDGIGKNINSIKQ